MKATQLSEETIVKMG